MNEIFKLVPQKKDEPIKKEQIKNLRGGDIRGERIFVVANLGRDFGFAVYSLQVKRNFRSQKPPSHPEGTLWLKSDLHKNENDFRYDISRTECAVPFFQAWNPGKISYYWRSFPAVIVQPKEETEEAIRLVRRARETKSRERLCLTLRNYPESISTADELVAERLGMMNPPDDDPARRVLRCIPWLDVAFVDDLRGAILAKGPVIPPAVPTAIAG